MTPTHYRCPLRSREAIADYLDGVGGYSSFRQGNSYFAFNVKAWGADLSLDNLIAVYRDGASGPNDHFLDDPEWLEAAGTRHGEVENELFEWGLEGARSLIDDSDCYDHLYDGTRVDVEYCWMGRSGGYVGIKSFEGRDFTQGHRDCWRDAFKGGPRRPGRYAHGEWTMDFPSFSYSSLRRLYRLVVMLSHDLTPEKASREVEHHATIHFVDHVCRDVPRVDATQLCFLFAS